MTIIDDIADALCESESMLVTAESCTGGLIGHILTNKVGAGSWYRGGIVAYDNGLKERLLGVSPATLEAKGAVSAEVADEMARGARRFLDSDYALSVTGLAGPRGGTEAKPVGLTYIGVATPEQVVVRRYLWRGSREGNKSSSARAALQLLHDVLIEGVAENSDHEGATPLSETHAVEALFQRDGSLVPRHFVWQGRRHEVSDHGRQWRDDGVRHFLVMSLGRVWELRFDERTLHWTVQPKGPSHMVV